MPVTVRGTDILFNDSTTQSTAGQPTSTALVLSATAGASVNAVGSYAYLRAVAGSASPGGTLAGSSLRYASSTGFYFTEASIPSGTWRCLGLALADGYNPPAGCTLWLRIS